MSPEFLLAAANYLKDEPNEQNIEEEAQVKAFKEEYMKKMPFPFSKNQRKAFKHGQKEKVWYRRKDTGQIYEC